MTARIHEIIVNLSAHPLVWGLAQLARRAGPVWRIPGFGILISDAEIAREILRRDDDFTKNGPGSFSEGMTAGLGPLALSNMDGEAHHRLRAAIADLLTPARADLLVASRESDLVSMRSHLARGDCVDLAHFIRGWSGRIVFDVVGIAPPVGSEEQASQDIVMLSERLAALLGFRPPSKRRVRVAQAVCEQIGSYFRGGFDRPAPAASLVGRVQQLDYTFEEAISLLVIFVMAGTLTISAALPRIVALLVDHGSFSRLAEDPACIPQVIEEGLRFIAPLPGTVRIVRRDVSVQGHKLSAGSRLLILTCNLARDANLFPEPDRFDIDRMHDSRARRLWYGAGPHRCAGLHLAQRELHTALDTIAGAAGDLQIVKRRASLGALLPAYSQLIVQATDRPGR